MQTGWKHDDHQTRREFERLRKEGAQAQGIVVPDADVVVRGGFPSVSDDQNPSIVVLRSPYETIDIQKLGQTFDLDRFLTVRLDDVDVAVRDSGVAKTVKYLNFRSGGNITFAITKGEDDEAIIEAVAIGAGFYTFDVSDSDETTTIGAGENIRFVGINSVVIELTPGTPNIFEIDRPLQIYEDGVAVGDESTSEIDFDSNGQTSTDVAINFEVDVISPTRLRVRGFVPAVSGAMTSWTLSDGTNDALVEDGDTVTGTGLNGVVFVVTGPDTFEIDRPLTIRDENVAVGGANTTDINFDSNGQTSTAVAVRFDVTDDTGGQRSIRGFIPNFLTSWSFDVLDSNESATIDSGDGVRFVGLNGVVVELTPGSPNLFEIDRPFSVYQTHDDDVNDFTSDDETIGITFENETSALPVTYTKRGYFVVTQTSTGQVKVESWYEDDASGAYTWDLEDSDEATTITNGQRVKFTGSKRVVVELTPGTPNIIDISRPLQMYVDGGVVGDDTTYEIDFDSNGQTSTDTSVNFVAVDIGGGRIQYRAYVPAGSYSWTAKAPIGDSGLAIGSGDDVTWHGVGDIQTSRIADIIYIERDPEPTGGRQPKRILMGFLEWDNTGVEPTGDYGFDVSADIEHNWGLINMHHWEIHYEIVNFDPDEEEDTLAYYRSGVTTDAGETEDEYAFSFKPHFLAHDGNTVRGWVTQSQGFPTVMKIWYVLREA